MTFNNLFPKEVITGIEVIQQLKEQEKRQKEFEESVEMEFSNRRGNEEIISI